MKVLIACEYSGRVREAFRKAGHDAVSCDLLPTEIPGPHYTGNVFDILYSGEWEGMVAFPPCTDLAVSGAGSFEEKQGVMGRQESSVDFFCKLWRAPIPNIALENPVGIMSTLIGKPEQYIQPWQFGHPEPKKTCLWLQGFPPLVPTNIVRPEFILGKDGKKYSRIHYMSGPHDKRAKLRSLTYQGVADAMGKQWGEWLWKNPDIGI
jgi:hypothetical protein